MSHTASVPGSPRKQLRGVAATARPGRRLGGRAKGTGNKLNGDIKQMVVHALHIAGGVDYLVKQANRHPVAFMGLVGRVLPLQVTGTGENGKLHIEFSWADAPDAPVITSNAEPPVIEANAEPGTDADVEVTFGGE